MVLQKIGSKLKYLFVHVPLKWEKKLKEPNVEKCHIKNFLLQFFPFFESKVLKPFFLYFFKIRQKISAQLNYLDENFQQNYFIFLKSRKFGTFLVKFKKDFLATQVSFLVRALFVSARWIS